MRPALKSASDIWTSSSNGCMLVSGAGSWTEADFTIECVPVWRWDEDGLPALSADGPEYNTVAVLAGSSSLIAAVAGACLSNWLSKFCKGSFVIGAGANGIMGFKNLLFRLVIRPVPSILTR